MTEHEGAPGRIYHLADPAEWAAAQAAGSYTRSTRDASLADVGFIHTSTSTQWPAVRHAFYADVATPLLLLEIDPSLLESPVVTEVGNHRTGERFPHIYGPLNVSAVVATHPVDPPHHA